MAYQQSPSDHLSQPRFAPNNLVSGVDMAEEAHRRWVSIAAYYVAQGKRFLESSRPAGWVDFEIDINAAG